MKCDVLFADGSFKFTPNIDSDMQWIIHAVFLSDKNMDADVGFILFHIIFKEGKNNHTARQYGMALTMIINHGIKEYGINLSQKYFRCMADYEKAERNALLKHLRIIGGEIEGCGYHFVIAIQKNIKKHELWSLYIKNKKFHYWCRMLMVIRDVPPYRVQEAFDLLYQVIAQYVPSEVIDKVKNFCNNYFIPTWMDGRYNIREWNGFNKRIRTNNRAESNNASLLLALGVHVTFYQWLRGLKEISALQIIKFKHFEKYGFDNKRDLYLHLKLSQLNKLRRLLNKNEINLWKYMQGLVLVYDKKYIEFDAQFGEIDDVDI